MKRDQIFVDDCVERLTFLGNVRSRAMFGGWGIYLDSRMFALVADGELFFKTDEQNRKDFLDAGSGPFVYSTRDGKRMAMSYYRAPEECFEGDGMVRWATLAVHAAQRAGSARSTGSGQKGAPTKKSKKASTKARKK